MALVDKLLNKLHIFSCESGLDRKRCIRTLERQIAERAYMGIQDTLQELEDGEFDEFRE